MVIVKKNCQIKNLFFDYKIGFFYVFIEFICYYNSDKENWGQK